jgi:predicted permease
VLDFITSSRRTLSAHIVKQITNPALVGFAIGLGLIMIPGGVPLSLERTSLFIAQSAAPTALFVSGILLSQKSDARNFQLASVITVMKVGVFPLIALMLIVWGRGYDLDTAKTTMLVAVAPVGLMALTFAPRYNVETGPIAIAMLWSMIISICLIPIIVVLA